MITTSITFLYEVRLRSWFHHIFIIHFKKTSLLASIHSSSSIRLTGKSIWEAQVVMMAPDVGTEWIALVRDLMRSSEGFVADTSIGTGGHRTPDETCF